MGILANDGHFSGALAYTINIILLSLSMSGLRTLSKVCKEFVILCNILVPYEMGTRAVAVF